MKRIFFSFFLFVIVTMLVLNFLFNPVAEMIAERLLSQQVNDYYRELVKGTFHMLVLDLTQRPQEQWRRRIETLRRQFGYPIGLTTADAAGLTVSEKQQALQQQVVVKTDGELFYLQIKGTPHLLSMGPISDPDLEFFNLQLILWTCVVVITALLALLWALPFWRKLKRISTAAAAFGSGRFDTRAKVPQRSALAPLAASFNHMADRIQELISAQRELTNAVSHELRTPIARIRFSIEMLLAAKTISKRKHYLSEILKDVDELDALVTESLTYARFDHGSPKLDWQPRKLASWVQAIVQTALHGYPEIEFSLNNRLPVPHCEVYLEPRYMERAIANLLQNAAKHAKERIEVWLEDQERCCCIHVDDDGSGIPEADRTRVFQAFTRLDNSRNRASGGHGLGLAIVQRVIAWHGGQVQVTDAPLGGARLTLCWPGLMPPGSALDIPAEAGENQTM